jgi:hypothetical protein
MRLYWRERRLWKKRGPLTSLCLLHCYHAFGECCWRWTLTFTSSVSSFQPTTELRKHSGRYLGSLGIIFTMWSTEKNRMKGISMHMDPLYVLGSGCDKFNCGVTIWHHGLLRVSCSWGLRSMAVAMGLQRSLKCLSLLRSAPCHQGQNAE